MDKDQKVGQTEIRNKVNIRRDCMDRYQLLYDAQMRGVYKALEIDPGEISLDDKLTLNDLGSRLWLNSFDDFAKAVAIGFGKGEYYENIYDIMEKNGLSLSDAIVFREDIYWILRGSGFDSKNDSKGHVINGDGENYKIMEKVSCGQGLDDKGMDALRHHGLPEWFLEACQTIKYAPSCYDYIGLALARYILLSRVSGYEKTLPRAVDYFKCDNEKAMNDAYKALGIAPGEIPLDDEKTLNSLSAKIKLTSFGDLVKSVGIGFGGGEYYKSIYSTMEKNGLSLREAIVFREDIYNLLRNYSYGGESEKDGVTPSGECFRVTHNVRTGRGMSEGTYKKLAGAGLPKWFLKACREISYAPSRSHFTGLALAKYVLKYYEIHAAK